MHNRRKALILLAAIPFCLAFGVTQQKRPSGGPKPPEQVDINHATLEELLNVPGMTRTWAGRILRFRPYRMKSELLDRGVVTSEVYARIKDSIVAHRDPK